MDDASRSRRSSISGEGSSGDEEIQQKEAGSERKAKKRRKYREKLRKRKRESQESQESTQNQKESPEEKQEFSNTTLSQVFTHYLLDPSIEQTPQETYTEPVPEDHSTEESAEPLDAFPCVPHVAGLLKALETASEALKKVLDTTSPEEDGLAVSDNDSSLGGDELTGSDSGSPSIDEVKESLLTYLRAEDKRIQDTYYLQSGKSTKFKAYIDSLNQLKAEEKPSQADVETLKGIIENIAQAASEKTHPWVDAAKSIFSAPQEPISWINWKKLKEGEAIFAEKESIEEVEWFSKLRQAYLDTLLAAVPREQPRVVPASPAGMCRASES